MSLSRYWGPPLLSFDVESNRELLLKPIGTIAEGKFTLGVGIFPSLYSNVNIVTHDDLRLVLKTNSRKTTPPESEKIHQTFELGVSKNLINYPVEVAIDNFFNIHSAVLGNSGSGKSNTVAHIVQEIHGKVDNSALGSRILIFDVNGEYKAAFSNEETSTISVKYFKPNVGDGEFNSFHLPHFLLSLDEWSAFLLATEATQRPFWDRALQESYRFFKIGSEDENEREIFVNYLRYRICNLIFNALRQADTDTARITTAASILGSIKSIILGIPEIMEASEDLLDDINELQGACSLNFGQNNNALDAETQRVYAKVDPHSAQEIINSKIQYGQYFDYRFLKVAAELILLEEDARGNRQIRGYTATMLTRLDYFLDNPDCKFMRETHTVNSREKFIAELWGEEQNKNQLVIIDTSELGPDILETLTSVVSRLLFDERKKLVGEARREKPVHLILDEAHRYIKKYQEYLLKENIFEKIAREGRKYSLYLIVSSQRPSELSETVLSQCANFVIHRIQNEKDMQYVKAILPYFSDDFTDKIKQSIPGEALVFGNCVSMPLHLKVHESAPPPNSKNCDIPKEWFQY